MALFKIVSGVLFITQQHADPASLVEIPDPTTAEGYMVQPGTRANFDDVFIYREVPVPVLDTSDDTVKKFTCVEVVRKGGSSYYIDDTIASIDALLGVS
jgi:hypothetical protein